MVAPSKIARLTLPALVRREDLGQGPGRCPAFKALDRARAQDQHAVGRFAAEHLLPGEGGDIELLPGKPLGEGRGCCIANYEAFTIRRDPVAIRHADARRGAVPGEDDIAGKIDLVKIRQGAIGRFDETHVVETQLLHHVGDPALAEALPGQHIDATLPEQRPQRHFDGACVGSRNDADEIVFGDFEDRPRFLDGLAQACLAGCSPVRAADKCITQRLRRPAGALGAGSG